MQFLEGDQSDEYQGAGAGQTEAGILRTWGIPTARISGSPPNPELPADNHRLHDVGGLRAYLIKAAKVMIYAAVDTLTRTRAETGLPY